MSKIHCVGGPRSDETTGFDRLVGTALRGVVVSLKRLRRYWGKRAKVAFRDRAILVAAVALPLVPVAATAQHAIDSQAAWTGESGIASYYGDRHQGKPTASGIRFDQRVLTAAHAWLPFGSKVRVTVLGTGKSVIVTITDRLYSKRRIIDLSTAAAQILEMMRAGVTMVRLEPG